MAAVCLLYRRWVCRSLFDNLTLDYVFTAACAAAGLTVVSVTSRASARRCALTFIHARADLLDAAL